MRPTLSAIKADGGGCVGSDVLEPTTMPELAARLADRRRPDEGAKAERVPSPR